MGKLIELPVRKVVDYYSIHGAADAWGWFVRWHYTDGTTQDYDFSFEEAAELVKHLCGVTVDRLA